MRTVPQKHPMGCAVACVASRCRMSYQRALRLFDVPRNAWTRGYYCAEVVRALRNAGFKYQFDAYDPVKHTRILEEPGVIIFIKADGQYLSGHYLLRTRSGWMNPWANCPVMIPVKSSIQKTRIGKIAYILYEDSRVAPGARD